MATTGLRIVLMGNGGYAASILTHLLARGERVVGCCARSAHRAPPFAVVRDAGYAFVRRFHTGARDPFTFRDPFHGIPSPRTIAARHHIPILDAEAIRSPAFLDAFRALAPDVLFVAGFHRLIPQQVLAVPTRTSINFHPSLLPKHRGGTPNRWVIRLGEAKTGVTAHFLTERFDDGAIVAQERIAVGEGETWGDVELRIAAAMPYVAERVLHAIAIGALRGVLQRAEDATHEPPFHGALQEIHWTLPAVVVQRTCNAVRPKSGGLTTLSGRRWCLWEVSVLPGSSGGGIPGTVTGFDGKGDPMIACGEGSVVIRSVLAGGRIRPAARAFRSAGVLPGDQCAVRSAVCAS